MCLRQLFDIKEKFSFESGVVKSGGTSHRPIRDKRLIQPCADGLMNGPSPEIDPSLPFQIIYAFSLAGVDASVSAQNKNHNESLK